MIITEFGPQETLAVRRPPGIGRVFYVNGQEGDDANNGIDPGTPFETITEALTHCTVAFENDYIVVLRGGGAEASFPIVIDTARVHIIGVSNDVAQRTPGYAAGAFPVFRIAADQVEIAGLQLLTDNANPAIEITTPAWGAWIRYCSFGTTVDVQDGIFAGVEGPVAGCIENNWFGHRVIRDGMRLMAPTRTIIRNNIFREVAGIGINITAGGAEVGAIIGNYFYAPIALAAGAGWGITINGSGGIIADNRASQTGDATGTNPYVDTSGAGVASRLNGWSNNYWGPGMAIAPA